MKNLLRIFPLFILIIVLASCSHIQKEENKYCGYWTHIELGAGNYGEDGHNKTSLRKTVLKDLSYVSQKPNFIDELPEAKDKPLNTQAQYSVLFWTLDKLVETQGPKGVFHVNDIYDDYANYTRNGLYFFPIEIGNNFIPRQEQESFINRGIFYKSATGWTSCPYYFPEGEVIDVKYGNVFLIKPK